MQWIVHYKFYGNQHHVVRWYVNIMNKITITPEKNDSVFPKHVLQL